MSRPPDSELPLSYLYAEYCDKVAADGRTPLPLVDWAKDDAHPPTFRVRPDVVALLTLSGTPPHPVPAWHPHDAAIREARRIAGRDGL